MGKAWEPQPTIDAVFEPKAAVDQPKRIAYQESVIPPSTPTLPEPIRTALREEKNRNDNQLIKLPTDQSRGNNNL